MTKQDKSEKVACIAAITAAFLMKDFGTWLPDFVLILLQLGWARGPGVQSAVQYFPKVFSGFKVKALCSSPKFLHYSCL